MRLTVASLQICVFSPRLNVWCGISRILQPQTRCMRKLLSYSSRRGVIFRNSYFDQVPTSILAPLFAMHHRKSLPLPLQEPSARSSDHPRFLEPPSPAVPSVSRRLKRRDTVDTRRTTVRPSCMPLKDSRVPAPSRAPAANLRRPLQDLESCSDFQYLRSYDETGRRFLAANPSRCAGQVNPTEQSRQDDVRSCISQVKRRRLQTVSTVTSISCSHEELRQGFSRVIRVLAACPELSRGDFSGGTKSSFISFEISVQPGFDVMRSICVELPIYFSRSSSARMKVENFIGNTDDDMDLEGNLEISVWIVPQ